MPCSVRGRATFFFLILIDVQLATDQLVPTSLARPVSTKWHGSFGSLVRINREEYALQICNILLLSFEYLSILHFVSFAVVKMTLSGRSYNAGILFCSNRWPLDLQSNARPVIKQGNKDVYK